jgi:hypothetical protein
LRLDEREDAVGKCGAFKRGHAIARPPPG